MPEYMTEIDVEDFIPGVFSPAIGTVIRDPVDTGFLLLIEDSELGIGSFSGIGTADRLVYRLGNLDEIDLNEILDLETMPPATGTILRNTVPTCAMFEIIVGGVPPWPGDTLRLIDFDYDDTHEYTPGMNIGTVMVVFSSRKSILLGSIADSVTGFDGCGVIDFLVFGQFKDVIA